MDSSRILSICCSFFLVCHGFLIFGYLNPSENRTMFEASRSWRRDDWTAGGLLGWGMGLQLNNDCVCKAWFRWCCQDRIRCDVIRCMLRWYQHGLELCLEVAANCSNELTVDFSPLMISSLIQMFWIWVHEKYINWLAWDAYFNIRLKVMTVGSEKRINDKRFELFVNSRIIYVITIDFGPFENKFLSHLEQVQSRMASLPTMEPILELLREVVATAATAATSIEPGNLRMKKDDEWRDGAAIWCILMLFWKNQTLNFPKSEIPTKILLWGSFLMKYCLVPLLNLPRRCAFEIYLISILPKQKIVALHEDQPFLTAV